MEDTPGSQATIWTVTANTTVEQCALAHSDNFDTDVCGRFFAQLGTPDGDCFPSNLTVENVTEGMDNTLVECFFPTPSDTVGSGILRIEQSQ